MALIKALGNEGRDEKECLWPLDCPYKHTKTDYGSQIP